MSVSVGSDALCVSVQFVGDDQAGTRGVGIDVVPVGQLPAGDPRAEEPLAHLSFGGARNRVTTSPQSSPQSDEIVEGDLTTGARGHLVEMAVPLRELSDIPVASRRFRWRLRASGDAAPAGGEFVSHPSGERSPGLISRSR